MKTLFDRVRTKLKEAIGKGCNGGFYHLAESVYNVIYFDGRRLSREQKEQLKKEYHYYLDNIMFQHQVEYVFEDCHGRLYNKFEDIPVHDVFYRTGYRWKRTKKMLMNDDWCIFRGNDIVRIEASEFRIGVFNAEPANRGA